MAVNDKIIETLCPLCDTASHIPIESIGKKIKCEKCDCDFEAVKFSPASLLHNFYKIAVKNDLISEKQFDDIFSEHKVAKKPGQTFSLEDVFVEKGLITSEQKNRLMLASVRKLNIQFVNLAVERNFISREEGDIALSQQAEDFRSDKLTLIGDILIKDGLIDQEKREGLLIEIQKGKVNKEDVKDLLNKGAPIPFIGMVALKKEIINSVELENALRIQEKLEKSGNPKPFEEVLFEAGMISRDMKDKLVLKTLKQLDKSLGEIALKIGFVTKEELKEAAGKQAARFKKYDYKPLFTILMNEECVAENEFDLIFSELKGVSQEQAVSWQKKGRIILSRIATERKTNKKEPRATVQTKKTQHTTHEDIIERERDHLDDEPADDKEEVDEEEEISLSISSDYLSAYITLASSLGNEILGSLDEWVKDIKEKIDENDIIFGVIIDESIRECIKIALTERKSFKVAIGEPAKEGKEGEIIYHFETNYLKAGVVTDDGFIDFRDRGDVPYVNKGELLAELIPAVQGKKGCDIFGSIIEVPEIKEVELKSGSGTILSEDGLKLFADVDGRPDLAINGQFSVFPEMAIKGDVDFETGNVDFKGNVSVQGTICQGFKVKGVNVTAKNINGGDVEVTGDIDVSGGIVDSTIKADGYIQAMYIKGAKIDIFGDLLIVKEIIDSNVKMSGMCKSERCKIINSKIAAKMGVEVSQIGTDVSKPCKIRVGVTDHIDAFLQDRNAELTQIKLKLEKNQAQMEDYLKRLRDEHQKLIEISMSQDSTENEIKQLDEIVTKNKNDMDVKELSMIEREIKENKHSLNEASKKIDRLFSNHDKLLDAVLGAMDSIERTIIEIENLNEDIAILVEKRDKESGKAVVKVRNKIFSKTMVSGKHTSIVLQEDLRNINISEVRISDPQKKVPPRWEMELKKPK